MLVWIRVIAGEMVRNTFKDLYTYIIYIICYDENCVSICDDYMVSIYHVEMITLQDGKEREIDVVL